MPRTVVGGSAQSLLEALAAPVDDAAVVWCATEIDPSPLLRAQGPLVGTVSPLPLTEGPSTPVSYPLHAHLPLPPPLSRPCATYVLFTADAVELLRPHLPSRAASAPQLIAELGARLTRLGYQHVGAPGLALRWSLDATDGVVLADGYDQALDSNANTSLETHRLWAATRIRPIRVVIDGACITTDVYNGTQRVVMEVARQLAATRPGAQVSVAVLAEFVASTRQALVGTNVAVVERGDGSAGDVVYRPYQILRVPELAWYQTAGRRAVVNQLDMIGFSNPTYHPSSDLFFLIRNLQRAMMLASDGVTFISEFGRRAALTELPDLQLERTTVVSCGADARPLEGKRPAAGPVGPYVLVLSSTFSHKNRSHAIDTFAAAVRRHEISGSLVVAGPEPAYGRATEDETRVLESEQAALAKRVVHLGQVTEDEKWWLLRNASAVLYPSTVEGFGLVPFESASVGVPCLSFRGTALGEILGDGPSTLPTWNTDVWADELAAILTDDDARAAALGHVRGAAETHTWRATALLTWDAIDRSIAMPRRVRTEHEGSFAAAVLPPQRMARLLGARAFYLRLVPYLQRRLSALRRKAPG